ncbi:MAG TPA: arsenic metallochaperone ArsD family protein [Clostridiaceae bacterium]|nr:arsenic metallochaperone ArsD family protein [Clostridiaceae bacterium]
MKKLLIYYTVPFLIPLEEKESYEDYLDYAAIAKRDGIPFEMISFQDSPGRFLTDTVIYEKLSEIGDEAFPITVLNDEFVKCSSLPTEEEFAVWFESLDNISFADLVKEASKIEHHHFPSEQEIMNFSCSGDCLSCDPNLCGIYDSDY